MDIGNLRFGKDNLVELKSPNKDKKSQDEKQGCLKLNDYLAF